MAVSGDVNSFPSNYLWDKLLLVSKHHFITHRVVQQVEPVVEAVNEREGVGYVVALRAEEQQHSQRDVFSTAGDESENTKLPLIKVSSKRSKTHTKLSLSLSTYLSV